MDVVRDPLPIGMVQPPQIVPVTANSIKLLPLDMALREPALPETEVYNIQLKKDDLGLGITVAGYVCEKGMHLFQFSMKMVLRTLPFLQKKFAMTLFLVISFMI